jgi:hypothetical protein
LQFNTPQAKANFVSKMIAHDGSMFVRLMEASRRAYETGNGPE